MPAAEFAYIYTYGHSLADCLMSRRLTTDCFVNSIQNKSNTHGDVLFVNFLIVYTNNKLR